MVHQELAEHQAQVVLRELQGAVVHLAQAVLQVLAVVVELQEVREHRGQAVHQEHQAQVVLRGHQEAWNIWFKRFFRN